MVCINCNNTDNNLIYILTVSGREFTLEQSNNLCPELAVKVPILSPDGFIACIKNPRMATLLPAEMLPDK